MNKNDLVKLAEKYQQGTATDEELRQLHEWFDAAGTGEEEVIVTGEDSTAVTLKQRMLEKVRQAAYESDLKKERVTIPYWRWVAAAACIGAMATGVYLLRINTGESSMTAEKSRPAGSGLILPGGDKATLTLGDGSTVVLDSTGNGIIGKQGNTNVVKAGGGQLLYSTGNTTSSTVMYNTLRTPRGGQFSLVLPDGSKVWLNAASSLRFPTAFAGASRDVELTGEAYFEIKEDAAKPFRLNVHHMNVDVLGTSFNVMAYDDERTMNTTLLTGAVRVNCGNETAVLKPGQQARSSRKGTIRVVTAADPEDAVAWKSGLFLFNNDDLETVMRNIGRWYDVEVELSQEVAHLTFTGQISRSENVSEVLKMLELTNAVHFKIAGRKVMAIP